MSGTKRQLQTTIDAVARHFSATRESGKGASDAYLVVAGKRVAVEVAAVKRRLGDRRRVAKVRLRFDRVVQRLVGALQANLSEDVPDGDAVILTVTAPIRLPSKTAAALEDKIRDHLTCRSPRVEMHDTIHGNQVRIRLVKGISVRASKVIGLVHNPDTDPVILLDITHSLLDCIGATTAKRGQVRSAEDRWLAIATEDELSPIEMYRRLYSQICIPTDFKKILLVLAGDRVETLTG